MRADPKDIGKSCRTCDWAWCWWTVRKHDVHPEAVRNQPQCLLLQNLLLFLCLHQCPPGTFWTLLSRLGLVRTSWYQDPMISTPISNSLGSVPTPKDLNLSQFLPPPWLHPPHPSIKLPVYTVSHTNWIRTWDCLKSLNDFTVPYGADTSYKIWFSAFF